MQLNWSELVEMDHYTQSSKTVKYFASIISHSTICTYMYRTKYRQKICITFPTDVPSAKAERKGEGGEGPETQLRP